MVILNVTDAIFEKLYILPNAPRCLGSDIWQKIFLSDNLSCCFFTHTCHDQDNIKNMPRSVSVSVYYVAVRTTVLSRHGSNLARPVSIHGLIYVPSTPCWGFFGISPDGNCAYVHWGSFSSNSKSVRRATDLRGSLSPTSVYSTWQSQAVTHPIMNRARRCLTSVIEHKPLSERRIPYINTAPGMFGSKIINSCKSSAYLWYLISYCFKIRCSGVVSNVNITGPSTETTV